MEEPKAGSGSISEKLEAAREIGAGAQESGIFDGVDIQAVSYLLEGCRIRRLEAGEVLLRAGESNQTLYFVLSGRLSIHLDDPGSEPINLCGPGHAIGELSVIDGNPTTAFVVADLPSELLAMSGDSFWDLVNVSHAFSMNLVLSIASRMRKADANMSQGLALRKIFEREATFDALTNLRNRRWFDANFPRFLQRNRMDGSPLSVFMADIDHFKRFNDGYGHAAGDLVLSSVASALQGQLRPTDSCVRLGGEEFIAILPGTDLEGAVVAAERIRIAVGGTRAELPDGTPLPPVTVSIGAAQAGEGEDCARILSRADQALYRAKRGGRNRVER